MHANRHWHLTAEPYQHAHPHEHIDVIEGRYPHDHAHITRGPRTPYPAKDGRWGARGTRQ